jgi:hypothetical protein
VSSLSSFSTLNLVVCPIPSSHDREYGSSPFEICFFAKEWLQCRTEVCVHRNAGGNVRAALRDIIILDQVLGLKEIAIVHHTDCGTLRFTDDGLRESVKKQIDEEHWKEIDEMHIGAITE